LSRQFGLIEYTPESVVEFPEGMPAFEQHTRFVLIERSGSAPLIFLQSLADDGLCFVTLPVGCVEPGYRPRLDKADFEALGMESFEDQEVLCLVILTIPAEGRPTVNMMAPVVIHRRTQRARQVIQFDSGYSFRQQLPVSPAAAAEREGQPC
jgi:flagellar assembly factor FliW